MVKGHFYCLARGQKRLQAASLRVMVEAPTELIHRLLPCMRARIYGRIVHVTGAKNRAAAWLFRLLPDRAGLRLMEGRGRKFRDSSR